MDPSLWILFVLTEGALSLTPGPAVLFVVSQAMRHPRGGALRASAGILTANALYFALSATGVGALLAMSTHFFTAVKWAGAAYLVYLGVSALAARPAQAAAPERRPAPRQRLVVRALLLQLSNPKALLFFMAILPQFVDRSRALGPQILILGITSILLELAILNLYGLASARAARMLRKGRFALLTERLGGALLLGAAFTLARLEL